MSRPAPLPRRPASFDPLWTIDPPDRADVAGVALDVEVDDDATVWTVALLTAEGARPQLRTEDGAQARREWILASRALGLPRLLARPDGGYAPIEASCGPLRTRAAIARRRGSATRTRRGRFLRRRKPGAPAPG